MKLVSFLFFTFFSLSVFSQNTEVYFNNGIVYVKNIKIDFIDTVFNGKTYRFPSGWNIDMGSDSILIAYPGSWKLMEGRDGHLVAFPPGWTADHSPDGRIVPFPYEEKVVKIREKIENCTDTDTNKCYRNIDKKVNIYGIYTQTGKDNREVRYSNDMTLSQGADGRLINIPQNWEVSQNAKGRLTAYPKSWAAYEIDDKQFAMPEDWEIDFETDSPKIIAGKNFLKFIYTPVEKIELAKHIYKVDTVNGLDYLIYLLVNQ